MGQPMPKAYYGNMLTEATVQSVDGQALVVLGPCGLVMCQLAASCLLQPKPKDLVAVALLENSAWVVSVLKQAKPTQEAQLTLPRHTKIVAESLDLESSTMGLSAKVLSLTGNVFLVGFGLVKQFVCTLVERVTKKIGSYHTLEQNVDDLAILAAYRAKINVKTSYRLRSENYDLKADKQVDIDGEHIKIG
ncbi:MAG: DUF3540 domain-containing protein [Desulfovibrionaceae bacterium]|nr:DUF3540 domain-containing protein [Desulfovibrionaceae bacterium]